MAADPLLDHLEKTFTDAYRKEIDQEENVWRSLPFFAATLALELAALSPVREWIVGVTGPVSIAAIVLLAIAAAATLAAIVCLAYSVWPADFQYVARELAFRDYAEKVREQAAFDDETEAKSEATERALRTVKAALAEQYATAADNNRVINQGRARWRTRAGLATLASVFIVLVLVVLVMVSNIHGYARQSDTRSAAYSPRPQHVGEFGPASTQQDRPAVDGGRAQGLVERPGDGAVRRGLGEGKP